MRINHLAALVVVGALLDVGVFTFQLIDNSRINHNQAQNDCWSAVLDELVKDTHGLTHAVGPLDRHQITRDARMCVGRP